MSRETWSARPTSSGTTDPATSARPAQKGIFRKEGDFWTLGLGEKTFSLKDTKGLGYIAHLLRHPGVEFHVLELFGGVPSPRLAEEGKGSTTGAPPAYV